MGSLRAHFFIALIPEFFLAGVEQATWLPAVGALASPVLPRRRIRTARVIGCFDYDRRFPRSASADPGQYDYDDARSLSGGPRRLDLSLSRGYDDGLEPMHASHVAARAVLVAKAAPRALPAARQVDAAWGPLHQYAHGPGPMTAIEHINYRHAFNSGFDNVRRSHRAPQHDRSSRTSTMRSAIRRFPCRKGGTAWLAAWDDIWAPTRAGTTLLGRRSAGGTGRTWPRIRGLPRSGMPRTSRGCEVGGRHSGSIPTRVDWSRWSSATSRFQGVTAAGDWCRGGRRIMRRSILTAGRGTEMAARLAERFKAAKGAPIEVDGVLVQMMYELPPIQAPAELRVELETSSGRPQGLRLKARDGDLLLNDQLLDDVVLWSDSAPPLVTAELRPKSKRKPMSLRVWNVWRDDAGTMQAWNGDAGLVVEREQAGTVILGCSDGFDQPSFGDLRVRLTLVESRKGRKTR
jgi:hypothetical protein